MTLPEQAASHRSIASAQPIDLYALAVPNTTTSGRDAGKNFQVAAVNVAGELIIDPSTGRAESDYYAISGRKGDVLTLEVDSTLLTRLAGADTIDSVLSVYDTQGNLVPYYGGLAQNDDQFEPTDSLLLDLVLPADGTYYVQVASFSRDPGAPIYDPTDPTSPLNSTNIDSPLNPLNPSFSQGRLDAFLATRDGTDTGGYGLFIYRYSAADPTDHGDTLDGRAGDDTLRGGLGVDSLIGGAGLDVIDSGEGGPGYVLAVAPTITSFDLFQPNTSIQTSATFADPSGSGYWDVTVDYGDGTVVLLPRYSTASAIPIGHTYATPGQFGVTITVQDDDGLIGQAAIAVTVHPNNLPTLATIADKTVDELANLAFTVQGSDPDQAYQTLTYTLLDAPDGATINPDTGEFSWTPTEAQGGDTYTITVQVADNAVPAGTAQATFQVTVNELKEVAFLPAPFGTGVYGSAGTLTATLVSHGAPLAGKLVSFTLNNGVVGTALTNASGVATLTGVSLAGLGAGTYVGYVGAGFAGDSEYHAGGKAGNLVVGKASLTITANSLSKTFGDTATFSGTEFTASGLVGSDAVSGVALSSPGAPSSAVVGNYPIIPSGAVSAGLGNYAISYVGGTLTVSTRAGSVYVLNPTAGASLSLSGAASLQVIGDLVVDSTSSAAIAASGSAAVSASSLRNMGGVSLSGVASVPASQGSPGSTGDPYAGLAVPAATGPVLSVNLGGSSIQTINPGTYRSIKVSGAAKLTLNPGVYVIAGGGLSVSGSGSISGAGVTIYNAGSNVLGGGDGTPTYGGIGLGGAGLMQLSAPTSGAYAGVLIFQSRDNTRALSLSGGSALGITGLIYAPKALLSISGNAQLTSHVPMVVDKLQLSGSGASTLTTEGTGVVVGELLAGDRSLYIDDPSGYLDADARARIDDAIARLNELLVPYSVTVSLTTDLATADLVLNTATTSEAGGVAEGVLGCYSDTGEIILIRGWNWFTGPDPSSIAADQFDFETIVTHELGHTLGLGHGADATSTMYASLAPGVARRYLTAADLGIRDSDEGPEGLHAALPGVATATVGGASGDASQVSDAVDSALEGFYPGLTAQASLFAPAEVVSSPSRGFRKPVGGKAIGAIAPAGPMKASARTPAQAHRLGKGTTTFNADRRRGHSQAPRPSPSNSRASWLLRVLPRMNDAALSLATVHRRIGD